MSLNWGITDILAIAKLSWDLYHGCYLVARGAPDEFRQLVNELASLQGVLRSLRDDISSDKSYLEKLDDNRKDTLEKCLQSCVTTLQKLEKLTVKYRKLGIGDGPQFWTKLKWTTKQKEISQIRNNIMVHTCNLSLCMSSIGNSSLARIEMSMERALERQEATSSRSTKQKQAEAEEEEEEEDELLPLDRTASEPATGSRPVNGDALGLGSITRQFTGATLVDNQNLSPDATPSPGEDDSRQLGSPPKPRYGAPAYGRMRKPSNIGSPETLSPETFTTPIPRSSTDGPIDENLKTQHNAYKQFGRRKVSETPTLIDDRDVCDEQPDVQDIVAEAMQELMKIRQKEQSARPLRIARPHPAHQPDDSLREKFQKLAEDELKIRRLNTRDWLRVATWWLLKARFNTKIDDDPLLYNSQASFSVSSNGKSTINQAYVDLLKASWILYNVILKDDNMASLMTDENRTLFYNLCDGINEDFNDFQPVDAPEMTILHEQNCNIWELLQPAEETYEEEGTFPGLENGRWITVEKDDAGAEDEKVLFRTFVDASIGRKTNRLRSKGAPYMLLLSTQEGESEPKVTLCNQSGTICVTRDLTIDDLPGSDLPMNPFAGSNISSKEAIPLGFDRLKVTVAFQNQEDMENFTFIPKAYFEAVKRREPRNLEKATETLLLSHSVEVFEQLEASTMKSLTPRQVHQSCDLRVLETTCKVGWRTTRRLVISSSAGEKKPWCIEVFLPLSRVQIRREGIARKLLVKWSDCAQKKVRTDGSYNPVHSYVYDETNPNIGHSLLFRNAQDATDFENTVFHLSIPPIFNWTSNLTSALVYMISDTEPDPKNYKAILTTHTRYDWKYSELYYMYRDIDYVYTRHDTSSVRIQFPQLYYTDYISTHVDRLYLPDAGDPHPHFSHCEKKVGNAHLDFDAESAAMAFMSSITSGHTLVFARRAHYITYKTPSRFSAGGIKSNKGTSEIQLWLKGSNTRLVGRWHDKVEDKWLSMTVPRNGLESKKDSNRASLPKVEFERGRKLDMAGLVARDPRDKKEAEGKRVGPVTIAFESVRDREEFAAALEGQLRPPLMAPMMQVENLMDLE